MSKNRWSEFEGRSLIQQWKDSGLDKMAFCKVHGISYGRLLYWCKRVQVLESNVPLPSGMVRLEIVPESSLGKLSIIGSNGLMLHLDASQSSVSFIKALLTA